ncbi:MAG: acetylxylan esterase [Victivallales bacterium]|nr:acetylxylan esterase [Victivallales bacterium]
MKSRLLPLLATVFALPLFAWDYVIQTNHPDALYKLGEKAIFTVKVKEKEGPAPTEGVINVRLDNFGSKEIASRKWNLADGDTFTMEGTLDEPGFLRLRLTAKNIKEKNWSVGYEPEKIVKGSPSPADFDEFWANAVKKLEATIPEDVQQTLLPERSTGAFNFWRISFATTNNRRVYGFLSVPKDASAQKKYPVRFSVPAAGYGNWTNNMKGSDNSVRMLICVYDYEPKFNLDEHKKAYEEMNKRCKEKYGTSYSHAGIAASREEYFFYAALLGINRAVNWLARQPYVNLRDFTYSGTSQGGGFGFYLTGLNHHFTRAVFYVPAITDTMGYLKGRHSGWPCVIERQPNPEAKASAEKNAPYFDGANFAARIQCPVRVAVGFSDSTCVPSAVYAAFNNIPVADKKIGHGLGMTHACFGKFYQEYGAWEASGEK